MYDVGNILKKQRAFFSSGKTKEVSFRIAMLQALRNAIKKYETEILYALKLDLNKAPFEAYETEMIIILDELRYTMKHLSDWAKPQRAKTPITLLVASSCVYREPYGSVLIMSPWNYPFLLTVAPLIGAIAAGNCSIVKPSETSFYTAEIIEKIVKEAFNASFVSVVRGGREANQSLLSEKFDYIFFTGGVEVGKTVMTAAAKHLTPVTLELGGKSPCIVDKTADIKLSAKRIAWGKFINAGQTCVSPDYVFVHSKKKDELIAEINKCIGAFYGDDPIANDDYPKIINQKHFERLMGLMESGHIAAGGRSDKETARIAPTVLDNVTWDSAVMKEEIFGPLLPVLTFDSLSEALSVLSDKPKPLALYFFTRSKKNEAEVIRTLSFGSCCINDTVIQIGNPHLPFGGVGQSGMGKYHGKAGFDTFSNVKGVMKRSIRVDIPLRYPPFKDHLALLKKIVK